MIDETSYIYTRIRVLLDRMNMQSVAQTIELHHGCHDMSLDDPWLSLHFHIVAAFVPHRGHTSLLSCCLELALKSQSGYAYDKIAWYVYIQKRIVHYYFVVVVTSL
jgi:hypothetical protein